MVEGQKVSNKCDLYLNVVFEWVRLHPDGVPRGGDVWSDG